MVRWLDLPTLPDLATARDLPRTADRALCLADAVLTLAEDLAGAWPAFATLTGFLTCAACAGGAATGKAITALHTTAQPPLRKASAMRCIQSLACIISGSCYSHMSY
jgi:hypothetical protein